MVDANMIPLVRHGFCWWRFVVARLISVLYSKYNFSVPIDIADIVDTFYTWGNSQLSFTVGALIHEMYCSGKAGLKYLILLEIGHKMNTWYSRETLHNQHYTRNSCNTWKLVIRAIKITRNS